MRGWIKRLTAVMLVWVCVVSLTGCEGKHAEEMKEDGGNPQRAELPGLAYEGQNLELSGVEGELLYDVVKGDKLYVLTGNTDEGLYWIYSTGLGGESVQCVASDLSEASVGAFCVDKNGNPVYLAGDGKEGKYELVRLDAQGEELFRSDVSDCFGLRSRAGSAEDEESAVGNIISFDEENGTDDVMVWNEREKSSTDDDIASDEREKNSTDDDIVSDEREKNGTGDDIVSDEREKNGIDDDIVSDEREKNGTDDILSDETEATSDGNTLLSDAFDGLAGITVREDGSVVMGCGEYVYFYDEELKQTGRVAVPSDILLDIALAKNGDIVCVTDRPGYERIYMAIYILNAASRQWSEPLDIRLTQYSESGNDLVMDGEDYDFYFRRNAGIGGYMIESDEDELLINEFKSYISNDDLDRIQAGAGGTFISLSTEYEADGVHKQLVVWKEHNPEEDKDKIVIRYGTAFWPNGPLMNEIASFNRSHSDYKIEIVDYNELEEERLLADIVAGKIADIIDLSPPFPLSAKQCAVKGLIEDLTPYFESETAFGTGDMVPSVYEAQMEMGGLYYVAPTFSIVSMLGRTCDVGDGTGWTVQDLKALVEQKGKDIELFEMEDEKWVTLWTFLQYTLSDYIDWENGVCHFDSEEFRYLLELSNAHGTSDEEQYSEEDIFEAVDTMYARMRAGEFLMTEDDTSLRRIQYNQAALGVPINYIGYPNQAADGTYFELGGIAMSSQSEHKEIVWEFLRRLLLPKFQKESSDIESLPVMQKSFDAKLKAITTSKPYVDELGELIEPIEEQEYQFDDKAVMIGIPNEEEVETYLEIVNRTKHVADTDMTVLNIVTEEAQAYFHGRQRIDKTVDAIQSRVTTYVNEQKK